MDAGRRRPVWPQLMVVAVLLALTVAWSSRTAARTPDREQGTQTEAQPEAPVQP